MRTSQWSDAVSVIERVTIVLGCFGADDQRVGISELARRANLPKSTVSRLVSELVEHRYLERDGAGVRLGLRLFELGELAAQPKALRTLALAAMADLRDVTGHTVQLAVLEGVEVVYVGVIHGRNPPAPRARIGSRLPAHATAVGKAILAFSAPDAVERVIETGLPLVGAAPVRVSAFRAQLDGVRAGGIALDSDSGADCVASPILDGAGRAVAAISVCGRTGAFDAPGAGPAVRTAALGLARRL
ncbi:IclR family transcriptional regulator [Conyzicola nivalis]|uniref:IclR family transcriptional regulator n=1 Tax=Conyzicola nivalis TaxID=1477021 RepID=A0A916SIE3_9MICO|nr:IclR family transcriptional regulator [Conyzicola nivalis]GGB01753.1 IclR family transcriptional regulator [Conyzicola nivalis]